MNKKLISIIEIKKRNLSFHARYSAKERIYEYIVLNRLAPPSIDRNKVWHIRKKLDVKLMKKAAKMLLGKKDFKTFQASNCYSPTSVKTLKKINIKQKNEKIEFQFKSKSFLRNQVRSMVGCLIYLGQKKCIAIECGLQNGTLAIFVGTTLFGGGTYVIPAATYSLIMFATSLIFVFFLRKTNN